MLKTEYLHATPAHVRRKFLDVHAARGSWAVSLPSTPLRSDFTASATKIEVERGSTCSRVGWTSSST